MAKKVLIEFNGKVAILAEHCKDLGVSCTSVYKRRQKTGEPYEKCLLYYLINGRSNCGGEKYHIEFNGKIACVAEHCRDLNIDYNTVTSRHQKTGESYIECLEYYQKNGVKKQSLHRKLVEDYSVKDSRLYYRWYNAKDRCENPKNRMYPRYGGRGIKVCERWQNYRNFENDMLESFLEHVKEFGLHDTQIERSNYNGDYEPSNCTWATSKEQSNNRSSNKIIFEGLNIAQFAEKYNINYELVRQRLDKGWTIEKIINTPVENTAKYCLPCNNGTKSLLEHCKQNKYAYNTVVSYIKQYNLQPHEALAKWLKMKTVRVFLK